MHFEFQINGRPPGDWTTQTALALEKRTEAVSRRMYPGLWRTTDRLNENKMPEDVLKRRRIRYKIYGVVLLLLGLFLLIPGLMDPKKLTVPLFAGLFASCNGLFQLLSRKTHPGKRYLRAAKQLLAQRNTAPETTIRFDEAGICDEETPIPFDRFDTIVEMPDLYLLTWNGKVLLLWKQELTNGSPDAFSSLLEQKHPVYRP